MHSFVVYGVVLGLVLLLLPVAFSAQGVAGWAVFTTYKDDACTSILVQEIDAFGPCFQHLNDQTGQPLYSYRQFWFPDQPAPGSQSGGTTTGTIRLYTYSDSACVSQNPSIITQGGSSVSQGRCYKNTPGPKSLPDPNANAASYTSSTFNFVAGSQMPSLQPLGLVYVSYTSPCGPNNQPNPNQQIASTWVYPQGTCLPDPSGSGYQGSWRCSSQNTDYFYFNLFSSASCCAGSTSKSCRVLAEQFIPDSCSTLQPGQDDSRYSYFTEVCSSSGNLNPYLQTNPASGQFSPEDVTGIGLGLSLTIFCMGLLYVRARRGVIAAGGVVATTTNAPPDFPTANATIANSTVQALSVNTSDCDENDTPKTGGSFMGIGSMRGSRSEPIAKVVPTAYSAASTGYRYPTWLTPEIPIVDLDSDIEMIERMEAREQADRENIARRSSQTSTTLHNVQNDNTTSAASTSVVSRPRPSAATTTGGGANLGINLGIGTITIGSSGVGIDIGIDALPASNAIEDNRESSTHPDRPSSPRPLSQA